MEKDYITAEYFRTIMMGKMPDGKVLYTLDGRPVTEEPEGTPEEKHFKRIINHVSGYVRETCAQITQTIPKAVVHCLVLQVRTPDCNAPHRAACLYTPSRFGSA